MHASGQMQTALVHWRQSGTFISRLESCLHSLRAPVFQGYRQKMVEGLLETPTHYQSSADLNRAPASSGQGSRPFLGYVSPATRCGGGRLLI